MSRRHPLSIVPLIALAGGLYAYVTIGLIAKVRKAYVRAGEIAEEVIDSNLRKYVELSCT